MPRFWPLTVVLLSVPAWARAETEPPISRRPADFSGAVGTYRLEASAEPTTLIAEGPLILTLTITGSGPEKENLPVRPKLRDRDELKDLFQIDDLPAQDSQPNPHTWKFRYRLRPRTPRVNKIPRLKFRYYKPGTGYQTSVSSSIPLTVKPRTRVSQDPTLVQGDGKFEPKYRLVTGEPVLRQESPEELPGPLVLALLFAVPPALCLVWYQVWRRWYPDAAELVGRRRSRAGRVALKALGSAGPNHVGGEMARRVAAVMNEYLRQRLDLPASELTPLEAAGHLRQAGVSAALAGRFADLFRACDAARFAPQPPSKEDDLARQAADLVRQLEAEPCLSRAS